MISGTKIKYTFLLLLIFNILPHEGFSELINKPDSAASKQTECVPHRYFRPLVYTNGFYTPESNVKTKGGEEQYSYRHFNSGFIVPMFTESFFSKDTCTISNFHMLASGNVMRSYPEYSGFVFPYALYKVSLGLRALYNTGNKNIWFANVVPFISQDDRQYGQPVVRFSSVFVFNRTVSQNFSYRLGYLRTYTISGHLINFPLLGVRVGRLDGAYLSIQFPKYASFNFPMGDKFSGAIFARPSGSIFNFSDFNGSHDKVQFRRYEMLYGMMMTYRANRNIALNFGSGFSGNRQISVSDSVVLLPAKSTLFVTAGVTIRFGKSISVRNNYLMYEAFDMNNTMDPDHGEIISNSDIPSIKDKEIKKIQFRDVMDLVNEDDLY